MRKFYENFFGRSRVCAVFICTDAVKSGTRSSWTRFRARSFRRSRPGRISGTRRSWWSWAGSRTGFRCGLLRGIVRQVSPDSDGVGLVSPVPGRTRAVSDSLALASILATIRKRILLLPMPRRSARFLSRRKSIHFLHSKRFRGFGAVRSFHWAVLGFRAFALCAGEARARAPHGEDAREAERRARRSLLGPVLQGQDDRRDYAVGPQSFLGRSCDKEQGSRAADAQPDSDGRHDGAPVGVRE